MIKDIIINYKPLVERKKQYKIKIMNVKDSYKSRNRDYNN